MPKNELHSREATEKIEAELKELARIASLPTGPDTRSASTEWRDFPGFWQKARQVSELFRSSDLEYEDRIRLWKEHQTLCDEVSRIRARERQVRRDSSKENREAVMSILKEAREALSVARTSGETGHIRSLLDHALGMIKQSFLLRQDRQDCWDSWHEADRALSLRRQQFSSDPPKPRIADRAIVETIELLSGMGERKRRNREALLRQIDGLQDDINRSWKLEWAIRAKSWVQEKRLRLEEIGRDIEELDRQIQELKGRLNI